MHGTEVVVVGNVVVGCPGVVEVVVVLGQGGRLVVGPVPGGIVPGDVVVVVPGTWVVVVPGNVVVVVPDGGPPWQPKDRNSDVKIPVSAGKKWTNLA